MAIYILNSDRDVAKSNSIAQEIRLAIPDAVEVVRVEDVLQEISRRADTENYLLLVASTYDQRFLAKLTDIAARYRDRIFFILIGGEISSSDYKALVGTGGADWVSTTTKPQELLDIISGARDRRGGEPARSAAHKKPTVLSLVPSAGGVGNSTLAIEIGIHLKTEKPTRELAACIVDLDFQSSHVCDYLDIEPRLQIQEISSNPERLDAQLFDIFISRHSSGLHVFSAPRSKADICDLNVEALDTLLDMISARYQLILIDLPVTWFAWTRQIIGVSDGVIVTGLNTIPGLRQTAETAAAVREAARTSSQIGLVINRCQRRLIGGIARRHHVESVLGRTNVFYIAEDAAALESINIGTPIAASRSSGGIGKDITPVLAFCHDMITTPAAVI